MKNIGWISVFLRKSRFLKYIMVIVAGVVIVGFVGDASVWNHIHNKQKISELTKEIEYYQGQYERDNTTLRRLDTDPKAVVEIAREHYFMKQEDEDIFVLSDYDK